MYLITSNYKTLTHEDVTIIVKEEIKGGAENLTTRVIAHVRGITGIQEDELPYDMRCWIYQDCKTVLNGTNIISSTGEDTKMNNFTSLPNRSN